MTLTIDVTVTGPDGSTASGAVTVDVTEPVTAAAEPARPSPAPAPRESMR